MNLIPYEESEAVVQQTTFEPSDASDTRSAWRKFVDGVRQSFGLKPLHLTERWATAKVRQQEAEVDTKLFTARAQYELAAAQARKIELQAEGEHAKNMALARYIDSLVRDAADPAVVADLIASKNQSLDEALANVEAVAEQIRLLGGSVEIEVNNTDTE